MDAKLETSHRTDDKVGFSSHDEKFIAKINTQIKDKIENMQYIMMMVSKLNRQHEQIIIAY